LGIKAFYCNAQRQDGVTFECTDKLLASVLKMHRSNKISSYPRGLC